MIDVFRLSTVIENELVQTRRVVSRLPRFFMIGRLEWIDVQDRVKVGFLQENVMACEIQGSKEDYEEE